MNFIEEFEPNPIKRLGLKMWLFRICLTNEIKYRMDMWRYREYFEEEE